MKIPGILNSDRIHSSGNRSKTNTGVNASLTQNHQQCINCVKAPVTSTTQSATSLQPHSNCVNLAHYVHLSVLVSLRDLRLNLFLKLLGSLAQ